jgi:flagellar biogenesis protein FliO
LDEISSQLILRGLVSLAFVLTVLGVLFWWLKSKGAGIGIGIEEETQLQILSRAQIDSRHKLVLIKTGNARFLVGTSPSSISVTPIDSSKQPAEFKDFLHASRNDEDN